MRALVLAGLVFAFAGVLHGQALTQEIIEPSAPAVVGYSGLNGHTITISGTGLPNYAIRCTAPGSQVVDTATIKGSITGAFYQGVTDCEKVTGLTIQAGSNLGYLDRGLGVGITNGNVGPADSITDNVIDGARSGINVSAAKTSSSTISNNYIVGRADDIDASGISAATTTGTPGPLYENNIIRAFGAVGIWVPSTGKIRVRRNVLFDEIPSPNTIICIGNDDPVSPPNSGIGANACDCTSGCSLEPPYAFPFQ